MSRQKPRSVPVYRNQTDQGLIKSFMASKSSDIVCQFILSTAEESWHALETAPDSGVQRRKLFP